jgi:sugar lactone lactonase YvrE
VSRSHGGCSGVAIGRCHQPGSNGLTFDPAGRLVMCQHGSSRTHNTTALADRYEGKRLNSLDDVVCERQHSFHPTGHLADEYTDAPYKASVPHALTFAPGLRVKPDFDPTTPQAREAWQAVTR